MIISRKKWDDLNGKLSELKAQTAQAAENIKAQNGEWNERLAGMKSALSRHDTTIEDMLESWEDWQEKLEAQEARQAEQEKNNAAAFLRREKELVQLLTEYHDQFFVLQRSAEETGNTAWCRQFSAAMEKLAEGLALAGIQVIDQPGVAFNFALHEAIDVTETATQGLDMQVAQVYSCGYIDHGTVIRKAKTSVYKLKETQP